MSVIGIKLLKDFIHIVVLEGTKSNPVFLKYRKAPTSKDSNQGARMKWFENFFNELLDDESPTEVGYCITYAPTKDQIPHITFPIALLLKATHERSIPAKQFTTSNFTATKFGLPRGSDMQTAAEKLSNEISPSNKGAKDAALAGWIILG